VLNSWCGWLHNASWCQKHQKCMLRYKPAVLRVHQQHHPAETLSTSTYRPHGSSLSCVQLICPPAYTTGHRVCPVPMTTPLSQAKFCSASILVYFTSSSVSGRASVLLSGMFLYAKSAIASLFFTLQIDTPYLWVPVQKAPREMGSQKLT
jgi:hypothetical protein